MKNIFLFIRRFFTFFLFLFLEGLCISFLVKYNRSYDAAYSETAHSITGAIDKRYNDLQYFFQLKKINKTLAAENAQLRTSVAHLLRKDDTLNSNRLYTYIDSLNTDSSGTVHKYQYYEAKVVNNSVTNDNNFLTIERGSNQGAQKDMAVAGPLGVVGRVIAVSPNYSIVMSLLNHNMHITAQLKRSGFNDGYVDWNGKKVNIVQLNNVPKTVDIKKGDTVMTSNLSQNFPEKMMIGRVLDFKLNPATSYYSVDIATSTDFYSMQYVYVIKNNFANEQKTLEASEQK
ncbi:MAG TPA: rod shape-determining protein MreC [Arachidicoccus sp.]